MASATDHQHWESVAKEWIAWARTPGHDAFWSYREAFSAFVGKGTGSAIDVGCGEGRIARELKRLGYKTTAVDTVPALVEAAREVDSADAYAVAPATALPFADAVFNRVVAYNLLMSVEDLDGTIREMCRVLKADGTMVISIVHPFQDGGFVERSEPDTPFVRRDSYFGRKRFEGAEERNGLSMHFAGWSQPLETYMAAFEANGLAMTALREPVPELNERNPHLKIWSRFPLFLWMKLRPLPNGRG